MSNMDAKAQRIHSESIRRTNRRRINHAATSKPTEKVKEIFRRKPYGKSNQPNEKDETEGL